LVLIQAVRLEGGSDESRAEKRKFSLYLLVWEMGAPGTLFLKNIFRGGRGSPTSP
jgi:hypothetical protein